jgi:hypothetical protein
MAVLNAWASTSGAINGFVIIDPFIRRAGGVDWLSLPCLNPA